jgi:hypothetical protein
MEHTDHINKLIGDALSSLDDAARATPKPYLFTRMLGRMQNSGDDNWDRVLKFINRPAVALALLCLVIVINILAFRFGNQNNNANIQDEQYVSADDFSSTVTALNYNENVEP